MTKIIFSGWEVGMRKISFTKLLHHDAGISLKEAHDITHRILNDEVITITVDDHNVAKEIFNQAKVLGVKAGIFS